MSIQDIHICPITNQFSLLYNSKNKVTQSKFPHFFFKFCLKKGKIWNYIYDLSLFVHSNTNIGFSESLLKWGPYKLRMLGPFWGPLASLVSSAASSMQLKVDGCALNMTIPTALQQWAPCNVCEQLSWVCLLRFLTLALLQWHKFPLDLKKVPVFISRTWLIREPH